jgi:hypothetical protein
MLRPVLDDQAGHFGEVANVVRHEYATQSHRVCRNQDVELSDRRSSLSEDVAESPELERRRVVERCDLNRFDESVGQRVKTR